MIKQHTKSWLEAKRSKIGGSEIFTLAHYYCKKELEQIGVDLKELTFKTPLEIYLEKKFGIQPEPIDPICAEFGLGMEKYIIHRLNKENSSINVTSSSNFEINDKLNNLACCSPDGFVEVSDEIEDYDKRTLINKESGSGMLEVKTTQFTFNYEAAAGAKWQYIFQLNYNMLVCDNKWGLLACLTPKEKEFDTDFFKGKSTGILKNIKGINPDFSEIDEFYNLYSYFYTANKTIQNICKIALDRFQNAMDNNKVPDLSKNQEKLMREKKMLARMYPEKYGKLQANQELNELLNERGIVNNQLKIDETAKEEVNCKLIQAMGHHIELEGFNYIAKFDKKGSLRVSQNKDSFVTQGMINKLLEDVEIPNYMGA
jgi:hypothetical protein